LSCSCCWKQPQQPPAVVAAAAASSPAAAADYLISWLLEDWVVNAEWRGWGDPAAGGAVALAHLPARHLQAV
jgi:hypothetical protein